MTCTKCKERRAIFHLGNMLVYEQQINRKYRVNLCRYCAASMLKVLLDLADMKHANSIVVQFGKKV